MEKFGKEPDVNIELDGSIILILHFNKEQDISIKLVKNAPPAPAGFS